MVALKAELAYPPRSLAMPSLTLAQAGEELQRRFLSLASREGVARLLDVPLPQFMYHVYKLEPSLRYTQFSMPKKSGGARTITAPVTPLKLIQRKLNQVLQHVYRCKPSVHGFVLTRGIVTNARCHLKRQFILSLDLEDFFPSINFGRVRGMFMSKPYGLPAEVATVLAQICCYRNQLPQGAPTSPIVSNMICRRMDTQLQLLAKKYRCTYSRYADDITLSTSATRFPRSLAFLGNKPDARRIQVGDELLAIVNSNGFRVNQRKVRMRTFGGRQEVTGLTVNRFPNVNRGLIRQIRAMIHAWNKFGLDAAQDEFYAKYNRKHRSPDDPRVSFERVVKGKIDFIGLVRGADDPLYIRLLRQYAKLNPGYTLRLKPIAVSIKSDIRDIKRSVWVLECEESCLQGTGFWLAGFGLVTCNHVLGPKTKAFRPERFNEKYPVEIIAQDSDIDLALLKVDAIPESELSIGEVDKLEQLDRITLYGCPGYHVGEEVQVRNGEVTGFRPWHGIKRILVSAPIIAGNSGGPVLDSRNRVIGVAVTGAETVEGADQTENHGVIPIDTLKHLSQCAGPAEVNTQAEAIPIEGTS